MRQIKPPLPPPKSRSKRSMRWFTFLPSLPKNNFHLLGDSDLYHWLLKISWRRFLTLIALFYVAVNFLFAFIYLTAMDGIANVRPHSLSDAFFFSIQTLSTVGYGSMYPTSVYAQILVTIEILVGLVLLAILTGLMFARFSRPTSKVLFSKIAVIGSYNGVPTLMFRAANKRDSKILEAKIQVSFLQNEISAEGHRLRRFYDVNLTRSRTPVFGLSWLIMHPIDENSPFYKTTLESLQDVDAELWISLSGLDETFASTIHSRYLYKASDILWNHRFVDIFSQDEQGEWLIDLGNFHDAHSLEEI